MNFAFFLILVSISFSAERETKIEFEGDVVEGLSQNSLDSLTQLHDRDEDGRLGVYKIQKDFSVEADQVLREVEVTR